MVCLPVYTFIVTVRLEAFLHFQYTTPYPHFFALWPLSYTGDKRIILLASSYRSVSKGNEPMSTQDSPAVPPRHVPWYGLGGSRQLFLPITLLAWIALIWVVFGFLDKINYPILVTVISIIIAYVLYPLVKLLSRLVPKVLAILITYIGVFAALVFFLYYVVWTALAQLLMLVGNVERELPVLAAKLQPIFAPFLQAGISIQQFLPVAQQVLTQILNIVGSLIPLIGNIFSWFITFIIITSLSVYFILDGHRVINWLRNKIPLQRRPQMSFFLDTINKTMGAYLRGQILTATITTVIEAIGLWLFGMPYVMLLALVVFVFEFVPQIGSYISAAIVIGFAFLTKGWQIGLVISLFSAIVHGGIDGQILIPRILGGAVGLHPIVALLALLVGAALFGLPGAIFAAPVAGVLQIFIVAGWQAWKREHPDQFPETETPVSVENPA